MRSKGRTRTLSSFVYLMLGVYFENIESYLFLFIFLNKRK